MLTPMQFLAKIVGNVNSERLQYVIYGMLEEFEQSVTKEEWKEFKELCHRNRFSREEEAAYLSIASLACDVYGRMESPKYNPAQESLVQLIERENLDTDEIDKLVESKVDLDKVIDNNL